MLRIWGSLQLIYSLIVERYIYCGCAPNGVALGFKILGILQVYSLPMGLVGTS